jgi:hypothetical protein
MPCDDLVNDEDHADVSTMVSSNPHCAAFPPLARSRGGGRTKKMDARRTNFTEIFGEEE